MSKKVLRAIAPLLVLCSLSAGTAYAEGTEVNQQAAQSEKIPTNDEAWNQQLKEKYALTDEQIKTLRDSGLNQPHMAKVAQLAKSSQKPIEDVLKMRTEQKMGWGKIAKELGVHPRELGHSVRDIKHAVRDERKQARSERKEKLETKKEERRNKQAKKDH